ncbi:MAG: DUF222 domain-containing protein [Actinomycetes bacterium]
MGELASALDALAAEDLYGLPAAGLLGRTAELVEARNRLDAELARTVRRAEVAQASEHDGLKSMASWLRGHARLSPAAAGRVVRDGRVLEQLPAVAAACTAGAVTAEQVAVIAPVVRPEHLCAAAEQGVDLAAVDVVLAQVAATRQHAHLAQVVHHYLSRLDPDGVEPDPTEGRSLSLAKHADGSLSGRFELDAVGGEKVQAALESFVQADRPAGDLRTRAQQLGDALVQLADVALASGALPVLRTVKPHVTVLIDLDDLADPATGPGAARTGFGALISAARARWLACDGTISRVVMGPDGQLLDHGRAKRIVPPPLRRAVEIRDRHCVFAGCEAPTSWCDVHHVQEWVLDDGPTSLENSALLCERHHTTVHHGFRVERQPDGRWRTWRPDGTEILLAEPVRAGH